MLILARSWDHGWFDRPVARRLRLQFAGATYHVINRGNYRRDVFSTAGAAKAFELALDEACQRHRWRLHAYAIMRNHYHLALETPEPNLVDGMHWLQSTYSTRFNRFRSERGHLFQGRYQALLIEDMTALARVVNYIHLNPVRAGIVPPAQVAAFRWGSLSRMVKSPRAEWLATDWIQAAGFEDSRAGWADYSAFLTTAPRPAKADEEHNEFCGGWAIGTAGWRKAIAKDHVWRALENGLQADELREVKEARWREAFERILQESGRSAESAQKERKGAEWKQRAAERLRKEAGAPHRWIAEMLGMGSPNSVRSYLSRMRITRGGDQQLSA